MYAIAGNPAGERGLIFQGWKAPHEDLELPTKRRLHPTAARRASTYHKGLPAA